MSAIGAAIVAALRALAGVFIGHFGQVAFDLLSGRMNEFAAANPQLGDEAAVRESLDKSGQIIRDLVHEIEDAAFDRNVYTKDEIATIKHGVVVWEGTARARSRDGIELPETVADGMTADAVSEMNAEKRG